MRVKELYSVLSRSFYKRYFLSCESQLHLFEGHARLFGVGNDIEVFACHDKVRDGIVHDGQDMRMVLLSHLPAYHSPPAKG